MTIDTSTSPASGELLLDLDAAIDAVVQLDEDGRIVGWNAAASRLFGWSAEETRGRRIPELIGRPEMRAEMAGLAPAHHRARLAAIVGRRVEMRAVDRDGRELLLELTTLQARPGGPARFVSFLRDVTAQRDHAERTAAVARFLDESPSPVLRVDGDGVVLFANGPARELIPGARIPVDLRDIPARVLRTGQREDRNWTVGDRILRMAFMPVRAGGYVNVFGSDVTDRVRVESDLEFSREGIATLAEIAVDRGVDLQERIRRLLGLMAERFGTGTGVLSRIEPDGFLMLETNAFDERLLAGTVMPFEEAFSTETARRRDVFALEDAVGTPWEHHLAHRKYGLRSYVGVPVVADGSVTGVLSFSSPAPRPDGFREADIEFLRLMAHWIGGELERQRLEEELAAARRQLEALRRTSGADRTDGHG